MKYKKGDIVLVQSAAGKAIPKFHVRLLEKIVVPASKGRFMDWHGYTTWKATPIYQKEVDPEFSKIEAKVNKREAKLSP